MSPKVKVSLSYGRFPDNSLITFARNVHDLIYAQSVFSGAPVTAADLQTGITGFNDAKVAQPNGGKQATAEKNQRRAELLELLDKLALFVQIQSNNDLPTLLSSGFEAQKRAHTPSTVTKPMILRITQTHPGEALVTTKAERSAYVYEVQAAEVDENGALGPYGPVVSRTSSRNIPVAGLTPGKMYVFRVRVISTRGEASAWSDSLSQRVI